MTNLAVNDMNDPARRSFTLDVTYQINSLLIFLFAAAKNGDSDELPYLLIGILPRLLDLNNVIMSAVGDDAQDLKHLECSATSGLA